MSARYFCDACGEEMRERDYDRVRRSLGHVTVEVMVSYKGTWNHGHVCHGCIGKVITDGIAVGSDRGYVRSLGSPM